jgi:hypothetical protein
MGDRREGRTEFIEDLPELIAVVKPVQRDEADRQQSDQRVTGSREA